jgi:hypothetical protein
MKMRPDEMSMTPLCLACGAPMTEDTNGCPSCGAVRADGIWRDGKLLVMHREGRLPNTCFISGQPTERREKLTLRWRNGAALYFFVFFASIPPSMFLVLPMLLLGIWIGFVRRVKIDFAISEESARELRRRRKRWLLPPTVVLAACAMSPFLTALYALKSHTLFLVVWMLVSLSFGMVFLVLYPLSVVAVTRFIQNNFGILLNRIKGDYIWLGGGHPSLLERLPAWPGDHFADASVTLKR